MQDPTQLVTNSITNRLYKKVWMFGEHKEQPTLRVCW